MIRYLIIPLALLVCAGAGALLGLIVGVAMIAFHILVQCALGWIVLVGAVMAVMAGVAGMLGIGAK